MAEGRSQFTFYESFYKAVSRIRKAADRAVAYDTICRFALYGDLPDEDSKKFVWKVFEECEPLITLDRRQSKEGRHCAEYKAWRRFVFERDNYTCQMCGLRGVKINAHHINQYAYCPDERYLVNNGVTLCVPCHKFVHRRRYNGD